MADIIREFQGYYRFLSNFFPASVCYDGMTFPSVENAYQAAKTLDFTQRTKFYNIRPGEAKRLGRRLKIREDWEQVKVDVMLELLRLKFAIPELRERLLATQDAELIEGNDWGDQFWGVSWGKGKNMLGKLLMQIRSEIHG